MGTFTLATTIARPPADVFDIVADPRAMPRWYEAVQRVDASATGPPAAGATYTMSRVLPGGRAENTVAITEYVPDRRVTFESREGRTPFRYRYELEPSADGTVLTLDASITGAGLPGPVARLDGLATRLFKRGMADNLRTLKRLVEANPAA